MGDFFPPSPESKAAIMDDDQLETAEIIEESEPAARMVNEALQPKMTEKEIDEYLDRIRSGNKETPAGAGAHKNSVFGDTFDPEN